MCLKLHSADPFVELHIRVAALLPVAAMVTKAMKSMPAMKSKAKPYYTKYWRTSWVGKYVRWRLKSITRARGRITEEWTGVRRKDIPKVMKVMKAMTAMKAKKAKKRAQ